MLINTALDSWVVIYSIKLWRTYLQIHPQFDNRGAFNKSALLSSGDKYIKKSLSV